jgi:hypothetical protein
MMGNTLNLEQVTRAAFFAALYADQRDIMPTIVGAWAGDGFPTEWRTQDRRRELFGKSEGPRYWLAR